MRGWIEEAVVMYTEAGGSRRDELSADSAEGWPLFAKLVSSEEKQLRI